MTDEGPQVFLRAFVLVSPCGQTARMAGRHRLPRLARWVRGPAVARGPAAAWVADIAAWAAGNLAEGNRLAVGMRPAAAGNPYSDFG